MAWYATASRGPPPSVTSLITVTGRRHRSCFFDPVAWSLGVISPFAATDQVLFHAVWTGASDGGEDIRHLLHTDANAVGALDPNHTIAPQGMTKVQLPHHHGAP